MAPVDLRFQGVVHRLGFAYLIPHLVQLVQSPNKVVAVLANRFHVNFPLVTGESTLEGPEHHHLANVLRLKSGEIITLFDGLGNEAKATLLTVAKRHSVVNVLLVQFRPGVLPFRLVVASALPKGDREMFLVEKLTELGVQELIPLQTKYSVVHPKDAQARLGRYALEACKQCGRNQLPLIRNLTSFSDFCAEGKESIRLLLHPSPTQTELPWSHFGKPLPEFRVAIGPEGGFSEEECDKAVAHGFQIWSLNTNILRIETAGLVAAISLANRLLPKNP